MVTSTATGTTPSHRNFGDEGAAVPVRERLAEVVYEGPWVVYKGPPRKCLSRKARREPERTAVYRLYLAVRIQPLPPAPVRAFGRASDVLPTLRRTVCRPVGNRAAFRIFLGPPRRPGRAISSGRELRSRMATISNSAATSPRNVAWVASSCSYDRRPAETATDPRPDTRGNEARRGSPPVRPGVRPELEPRPNRVGARVDASPAAPGRPKEKGPARRRPTPGAAHSSDRVQDSTAVHPGHRAGVRCSRGAGDPESQWPVGAVETRPAGFRGACGRAAVTRVQGDGGKPQVFRRPRQPRRRPQAPTPPPAPRESALGRPEVHRPLRGCPATLSLRVQTLGSRGGTDSPGAE